MQQLEASERPWLSIKADIEKPLTFNAPRLIPGVPSGFIPGETGAMVTIKFTLINKGHSPAESVQILPAFYPESSTHNPKDEQTKSCGGGKGKSLRPLNSSIGHTILPGDPLEEVITTTANKKDLDLAVAEFRKRFEALRPGLGSKVTPSISLFVAGCATYQSSFTNAAVVGSTEPTKEWQAAYQTGFSYYIVKRTQTNNGFDPADGDVPVSSLELVPNPFWGFYAY